ncbi:MAG TPA: helix-turn-helix domain-containing protein, partial [Novosphingobium sp.]|nr:helix-turn-helix domain-containing protein [Novosphingobium sp.]
MTDEIKSAARVLDMLEMFSTRCDAMTLSEVARGLSLPKSSALGLLRTLHKRGYLVRVDDNDAYQLNDMIRRDGFARHGRLLRVAPPILTQLAQESGETVLLGMQDAPGYVRLIAKYPSPNDLRYDIEVPRKLPAWNSAIGHVLLGRADEAALEAVLEAAPFGHLGTGVLASREAARAAILAGRDSGTARLVDEASMGVAHLAALIPLGPGQP